MRNLDRDLLVLAKQHRRIVLTIIDDGIVQATKARAGIHRDVWKIIALDQIDNHVGLPFALDFAFAHFRPEVLFLEQRVLITTSEEAIRRELVPRTR